MSKQLKPNNDTLKPHPTLYPTVVGNFTVWAKKQIGSMKAEQIGILTFERMRFSEKIMVYGSYGDFRDDGNHNGTIINELGMYKSLTYDECLEAFNFGLDLQRFEQAFFLTQTPESHV